MNTSWQIGKVRITQIVELIDSEMFLGLFPLATREEINSIAWLHPHFADSKGNLIAYVQSFLIESNGEKILIDTCNGNEKNRPNVPTWSMLHTDYLEKIESAGAKPEDISKVICTHLHFDHVGWNTRFENGKLVPTFPNAQYLFSKQEYEYWKGKPEKEMEDDHKGIVDSVKPIIEAHLATFVDDNHQVDSHLKFIPTPGHTPHHVSIAIESENQKAVITGDVLHHPCQIAHPEWSTVVDTFPEQGIDSRNKFIENVSDKDVLIIGTHFADPVAGHIVKRENGNEFMIEKK